VSDELKLVTVPRDLYYHEVAYVRRLEAALREIAAKRKLDAVAAASMQAIARAALAPEREYDPNVAPCDDAEFGMKP
jgi:hypothetical protein